MSHFGIFAKYWLPNAVKTRLAKAIGPEAASELYGCFVRHLLSTFAATAERRTLAYWPAEAHDQFVAAAGPSWQMRVQRGHELGQRMLHFFQEAYEQGARRTVLIGSDSPLLNPQDIGQAFDLLRDHPVVLGPAEDGGYYLIGLQEPRPDLFVDIEWSSARVLAETLNRLERSRVPYALLPSGYDVDELEDLRRLADDLQKKTCDAACAELRRAVSAALGAVRHGEGA